MKLFATMSILVVAALAALVPVALAARAPDLVERYVTSHPSGSSVTPGRYVETYGLAPSSEALAARTTTTSGGGIDWDGFTVIGGSVLFLAVLLATGATVALRHSRDGYASV